MVDSPEESRRDAIVARFKVARAGYERCVGDVTPDAGTSGTEWSISDLLDHVKDSYWQDMARRFISEGSPQFTGSYDPEAEWRQTVRDAMANIDDALRVADALTSEQMNRVGQRRGQPFTALDALELCADHFEEHLAQLRDEIRPREGLPLGPR